MQSRWIAIVLAPLAAGACAQVLGLDEPTVDEGVGGSGGTVVGSTVTSSAVTSSTAAVSGVSSTSSGEGGRETSSSSTASTGSGGAGPCDEHADCDDDNLCTADLCVEEQCFHEPIAAPQDDPTDCIDVTCAGDVETQTADDSEDPPDPSPPCRTTVCSGGAPMNVDAEAGTSCGEPPLECNGSGACIGCTTAADCGEDTECATPVCGEDGVCDPGLVAQGTAVDDPDGNCVRLECSGASGVPTQLTDTTDEPADATCGTGYCAGSIPLQQADSAGTSCMVGEFTGVCRGNQMTGDAACVQCTNGDQCEYTAEGDECLNEDGFVCGCKSENDCQAYWRLGNRCIPVAGADSCGCIVDNDCTLNMHGDACLGTDVCGCVTDADCGNAQLGEECLDGTCGCIGAADCLDSQLGEECVDGHCGCLVELDCPAGTNCDEPSGFCID